MQVAPNPRYEPSVTLLPILSQYVFFFFFFLRFICLETFVLKQHSTKLLSSVFISTCTPANAVQTLHAARKLNAWANKYQAKEGISRPLPQSRNYGPRSTLFAPVRPALTMH